MIASEKVCFSYSNKKFILNNITFKASRGQCLAILGNNGAGKSTLLKCINGICMPRSGTVYVNGEDVKRLKRKDIAKKMAFVPQQNGASRLTVFDAVLLGRKPYIKINPKGEDIKIVEDIIERMGLKELNLRYIDELSGGELQKVMIARALAQQPKVLLLDEPTSNLDLYNQHEVMGIIRRIAKEDNILVVIVIHDLNLALRYCDRFIFIKDGLVFASGGSEIVNSKTIFSVYGIKAEVVKLNDIKVVVPL